MARGIAAAFLLWLVLGAASPARAHICCPDCCDVDHLAMICAAAGERDAANPCRVCDAATDAFGWTVDAGCFIDGLCRAAGERDAASPCLVCDPEANRVEWSVEGCFIDGACVAEGATEDGFPCHRCRFPNVLAWTAAPAGSACPADALACTDDVCDETGACAHPEANCDDGDDCTEDGCAEPGGCSHRTICDAGVDAGHDAGPADAGTDGAVDAGGPDSGPPRPGGGGCSAAGRIAPLPVPLLALLFLCYPRRSWRDGATPSRTRLGRSSRPGCSGSARGRTPTPTAPRSAAPSRGCRAGSSPCSSPITGRSPSTRRRPPIA